MTRGGTRNSRSLHYASTSLREAEASVGMTNRFSDVALSVTCASVVKSTYASVVK